MSTASDMVTTFEAAMARNAGVVQVTIDGVTVRYDRSQALTELDYWRRRMAREAGVRPIASHIDLSGS